MNLGQLLGEQQLRIWELEEQCENRGRQVKRGPALLPPDPTPEIGLTEQIRRVMRAAPGPMTIDEIADALRHFPRQRISPAVQVAAAQGRLERHGNGAGARFGLRS